MNGFTQKDCDFYDVIKQIEIRHQPIKINRNTIYSVIDKQNKKIINKTFEQCFLLDKDRYIIRKIIAIDLEGKFINEGDYIWYMDISIGESLAVIGNGYAQNKEHCFIYEDMQYWINCIVVGNIYQGLKIDKYVMEKYCINLEHFLECKSFADKHLTVF